MSVAVIIVNWHCEEQTLARVAALRGWAKLAPQLVVVDNESTPDSRQALSRALAPSELVPSKTNLGYGGGNNLGFKHALKARAQYLLLLNPDADISEDEAVRLTARLDAHPEISILGPVLHEQQHGGERCYIGGRDISRSRYTRISVGADALKRVPGYPLSEVDYVPGAVFLARREVFETAGLFDESFFFSGETADLCKRARDLGAKSFIDLEVSANHDARATPKSMRETLYAYYSLRNRMLYGHKHHGDALVGNLAFWGAICMAELSKAVAKGEMAKARAIFLAFTHGVANRSGNQNAVFI